MRMSKNMKAVNISAISRRARALVRPRPRPADRARGWAHHVEPPLPLSWRVATRVQITDTEVLTTLQLPKLEKVANLRVRA